MIHDRLCLSQDYRVLNQHIATAHKRLPTLPVSCWMKRSWSGPVAVDASSPMLCACGIYCMQLHNLHATQRNVLKYFGFNFDDDAISLLSSKTGILGSSTRNLRFASSASNSLTFCFKRVCRSADLHHQYTGLRYLHIGKCWRGGAAHASSSSVVGGSDRVLLSHACAGNHLQRSHEYSWAFSPSEERLCLPFWRHQVGVVAGIMVTFHFYSPLLTLITGSIRLPGPGEKEVAGLVVSGIGNLITHLKYVLSCMSVPTISLRLKRFLKAVIRFSKLILLELICFLPHSAYFVRHRGKLAFSLLVMLRASDEARLS